MQEHFKEKAKRELREFFLCFVYFSFFFCAFIFYSNLVLSEYSLGYLRYGFGLFEAFILAKVVTVGRNMGLGDKLFAGYPLIFPTIYKSILFSLLVGAFGILEHYVEGFFFHKKDLATINHEFLSQGIQFIAARSLVKFVALVPFFAFLEMEKALGEGKIYKLFFRR